jgi:hypothetical protein
MPIQPGMLALGEYMQIKWTGGVGYPAHNLGYLNGERHGEGRAVDIRLLATNPTGLERGDHLYGWLKRYVPSATQVRWRGFCWDYGKERTGCQQADHMNHVHVGLEWGAARNPNLVSELPAEARREADAVLGGPQEDILNELQNAILTKLYTQSSKIKRAVRGLSRKGRKTNRMLRKLEVQADAIIEAHAEK